MTLPFRVDVDYRDGTTRTYFRETDDLAGDLIALIEETFPSATVKVTDLTPPGPRLIDREPTDEEIYGRCYVADARHEHDRTL